jgi:hypothetical protein
VEDGNMKRLAILSVFALAGCGGSSDVPDTESETITLTMSPFVVPAGGEVYRCQDFANPFGGEGAFDAIESHLSVGSHHLFVFYRDGITNGPVEECSGLEFSPGPFATQLRDERLDYPSGIAAVIGAGQGIRLNAHYLNTSSQDLSPTVVVKIHRVPPNVPYHRAGMFVMSTLKLDIEPYQSKTIPVDCTAPADMNLVSVSSHMHRHGVAFRSDVAGQFLYTSSTWDDPPRKLFEPSRVIKMGDKIHFECDYVNNSASPLTFGESASTNEMCVLFGQFYPYDTNGQVSLDCSAAGP